jgi:hypothetical protein
LSLQIPIGGIAELEKGSGGQPIFAKGRSILAPWSPHGLIFGRRQAQYLAVHALFTE